MDNSKIKYLLQSLIGVILFSFVSACTPCCVETLVKVETKEKDDKDVKDEKDKEDDACDTDKDDKDSAKDDKDKKEKEDKDSDNDKDEKKDDEKDAEEKPLKMGNLAIPIASQQPGPLVGLGENVIDEGESQVFLFFDDFLGRKKFFIDVIPAYLYGITDDLSIFINIPYAPKFGDGPFYSSGFEDIFAQFEYAYYTKESTTYSDQATVLAAFFVPTGSARKIPNTGFGPCFLMGTTFNRTAIDWFGFTSYGAIITGKVNGTKVGNNYFYEYGFGRNICYVPDEWIFSWMVEINGLYTEKNIYNDIRDKNSGGNVIYVNPSLWYSREDLIVQVGFGYAAIQHFNGRQNKEGFLALLNIGWTLPYQKKGEEADK